MRLAFRSCSVAPGISTLRSSLRMEVPLGWTPLRCAAFDGQLDVCKAIMDNILDKNPKDNEGMTPLHCAAERGHLGICTYIMDHLQNKNPKDNHDWTPLHCAANEGHLDVYNAMTKIVDDKDLICINGMTPRELLLCKVNKINGD